MDNLLLLSAYWLSNSVTLTRSLLLLLSLTSKDISFKIMMKVLIIVVITE